LHNILESHVKKALRAASGLLLLLLAPAPAFSQTQALKKIHIGVPSITVGNIVIYVANEAKLYQKYGLDPDIKKMDGSAVAAKAMLAGKIDVAPIATPRVLESDLAGADLVVLAHTMPSVIHAMMARQDIRRPEDLKGRKIGISNFGSLTDFLVRHILRQKGLNPERDVTLVQIGGDGERLAALSRGTIDAAALSYPGYAKAQKLGFPMLWDSSKEIAYPWIEVVARRSTIQRDRERVLDYMKAHLEGIALFKRDAGFGRRVIKKTLKIDDEGLVSDSYLLFAKTFSIIPYPNVAGMRTSFEYVAQTRADIWRHKPEEFIDASFVEELEKSGFIKKLYEKP
jgi:NitT/TauT family transport system substrate-binding protein